MFSQVFVCPRRGGVSVHGVSIRGGLCPGVFGGVYPGGLCLRGSLSWGVSAQGGVSVTEIPPDGYVRAVHILLECILVIE